MILSHVGTYQSPEGGALNPARVGEGELYFEMMTHGEAVAPDDGSLCGAGWIFAHAAGEDTVFRSPTRYECMVALFEGVESGEEEWPRKFLWDDADQAQAFSREILTAFYRMNLGVEVTGELIRAQFRFRLSIDRLRTERERIPARVSAVLNFMDRHYGDPIGMEDLAKRVGLSPSHLHARFKEFVGTTPHRYLVRTRMRAARQRLATTRDPIKVIAEEVGYANVENFCRAFKRDTGLTAAAFRRKYMLYS